jgi:hypothetical protein
MSPRGQQVASGSTHMLFLAPTCHGYVFQCIDEIALRIHMHARVSCRAGGGRGGGTSLVQHSTQSHKCSLLLLVSV